MGSSLIVGLKTRLATSRSTKQDVRRGRCCACLRQWLRHVQGRLRRRRRPQGRLPLHRWTSPPPGCDGRYGTEGRLRRGRGPVQEGYPHPEVPRRARNHHQLGRHGEDLAPHLLQRAPRCPREEVLRLDRRLYPGFPLHLPADVDLQAGVRRARPLHRPPQVLLSAHSPCSLLPRGEENNILDQIATIFIYLSVGLFPVFYSTIFPSFGHLGTRPFG